MIVFGGRRETSWRRVSRLTGTCYIRSDHLPWAAAVASYFSFSLPVSPPQRIAAARVTIVSFSGS